MGYILEGMQKEVAKRNESLGGHIVGLANKKEDDDNNSDVEPRKVFIIH